MTEFGIIETTFIWSTIVSVLSICIGWPLGTLFLRVNKSQQNMIIGMGIVVMATPAYAIFYAWWQMWPAGTAFHNWIVENDIQQECIHLSLLFALIGWSWPFATLVSVLSQKQWGCVSLSLMDRPPLVTCVKTFFGTHINGLLTAFLIVFVATASNTTSFDLAQIRTLGNELRIITSSGQSLSSFPLLIFVSICLAVLASMFVIRMKPTEFEIKKENYKSSAIFLFVWLLFSVLPVTVSAFNSLTVNDLNLLEVYRNDLMQSSLIGISVALVVAFMTVIAFQLKTCRTNASRVLLLMLKVLGLCIAFTPNTLLAESLRSIFLIVDPVYQSQALLIIAQSLKISFIAFYMGEWIASSKELNTLSVLDYSHTFLNKFRIYAPRLKIGVVLIGCFSIAYSFSNVSLTAQLTPPSSHQPIAVALLNAMHYQRPELVTLVFIFIQLSAIVLGLLVLTMNKRRTLALLCLLCCLGCESESVRPVASSQIIGGIGLGDGRFVTPRAIDANDDFIVVIDKSRRCQILNLDGECLDSWELPIGTKGFPTGVTLDDDGNIWVPNTHDQNILVMAQDGAVLRSFGSYGLGEGEFLYPTDIAFSNDKVFISEYGGNDRVSVFTHEGTYLYSFGSIGSGDGQFKRPQSIAIHPVSGELYIANAGNHRIDVFSPSGNWLRTIGSAGRSGGELLYPYGIDFVDEDHFIVCEYGNNRLQIFSVNGESKGLLGSAGLGSGLFKTPWSVVKLKKGLLVADTGNNRLQSLPDIMDN